MKYVGSELELFAGAHNWKAYLADQMRQYVMGNVLEVGAGIGSNIPLLFNTSVASWLALEPDPRLASMIEQKLSRGELPTPCHVTNGTIASLGDRDLFDTIVYVDVLEHIANDVEEVARASCHLAPAGHLIVLAPAHQFLFSPFDGSVGHVRRYNATTLKALTPLSCRVKTVRMLDCAGFFLSLANRLIMKSPMPTRRQIDLWDSVLVPCSRLMDKMTGFRFGKSVIIIWQATENG